MIYAQIVRGGRLHIAAEAGEEDRHGNIVRKGYLSAPLCGQHMKGNYRMTCNLPLANLCRKCRKAAQ